MVGDIHPNIIKPHRCQRLLNGWLYPCLTLLPFGSHAQNLLHQPVSETLKGLIHTGGHYPRLRLKQKHRLHHRNIKYPRCSPIRYLPPQKVTSHIHFTCAHHRFCSTTGHFSLEDNIVHPKYLNEGSVISGVPYYEKNPPICSSVSATTSLRRFLSNPVLYQLSASCRTKISHWGYRGGG